MSSDRGVATLSKANSEPFQYAAVKGDVGTGNETPVPWAMENGPSKSEIEQRERRVYEQGARDSEARAAAGMQAEIARIRAMVGKALEEFKTQRESYFNRIEPEVVQLALAITRKILHREAQMDPLLLTGMVHVALEKLDSGTRVRMRVHPSDIHSWNDSFAQLDAPGRVPELVGDAALQHGECAIETEIGSTIVSLDTQLKEIEQGFFDLLEQRPRVR
jgi:flagellar assembly protein FliH